MEKLDDVMVKFQRFKPTILAIDNQMEKVMTMRQKPADTKDDFMKAIVNQVKVFKKHSGGFMWGKTQHKSFEKEIVNAKMAFKLKNGVEMTTQKEKEEKRVARLKLKENITAITILKRADKKRFRNLQIKVQNAYLLRNDEEQKTVTDVLKLLNNYKQEWIGTNRNDPNKGPNNSSSGHQRALSFVQTTNDIRYLQGTNNTSFLRALCHACGRHGHIQRKCQVAIDKDGTRIVTKGENTDANTTTVATFWNTSQPNECVSHRSKLDSP